MAKQKSVKTTSRAGGNEHRPARRGSTPPPRTGFSPLAVTTVVAAVLLLVAVSVLWFTSRQTPQDDVTGARIEHVHGLGINPADGSVYAAAHNGVFRLGRGGEARRVGDGEQDTMGFTVAGADHFLASGHPSPGSGEPPHLGLIESADGGVTWTPLSLAGEADLHALRFRHGRVYGFDSVSGQFMVSADKKAWENRSQVALRDFAVSPSDPETLVASGERGLLRSADGGRTWSEADAAVLLFDWPTEDQLWTVAAGGEVMLSSDGGATWSTKGSVDGQATAFAVHDRALYVATHDGRIQRSRDGGRTWDTIYS